MDVYDPQNLIFLPGMDGTGISFEPLQEFIPANFKVTIVTYPTEKIFSFEEIVDCAAKQVACCENAVVVAESFSGPVAIELIAAGKIKARCLVLCATFAEAPRPLLLQIARLLPLGFLMGCPVPKMVLKYILGGDEFADRLLPLWFKVRQMVSPHVLAHRLRIIRLIDVKKNLSKLSIPCCYIQAIDDRIVPSSSLTVFENNISNLVVKRIKGPHFILQAQPQVCLSIIEKFIKHITSSSSEKPAMN